MRHAIDRHVVARRTHFKHNGLLPCYYVFVKMYFAYRTCCTYLLFLRFLINTKVVEMVCICSGERRVLLKVSFVVTLSYQTANIYCLQIIERQKRQTVFTVRII